MKNNLSAVNVIEKITKEFVPELSNNMRDFKKVINIVNKHIGPGFADLLRYSLYSKFSYKPYLKPGSPPSGHEILRAEREWSSFKPSSVFYQNLPYCLWVIKSRWCANDTKTYD